MKTALTIQNLVKRYGNVEAVRGVSFDVAEGEVFGLLGPNGAGKTTTVECAIGLRHADSGRVEIAGVDVALHPRRAKELFGAQLQTSALQDKITPREALRLFAAFYPRAADVDGMLEQFDLLEKADQAFDTLSIGQRRRLEIAAALIHEPRVLFLDEPTAGMDPLGRREFHGLIARLAQEGRAIVLTTHLIDEAQRLCDRVAIMGAGAITALDTPAALIAESKVPPRLLAKVGGTLGEEELRELPGVTRAARVSGYWRLETTDMIASIQGLMKLLEVRRETLLDLQIHQPTLEDVLLERIDSPFGIRAPGEES